MTITITAEDRRLCAEMRNAALDETGDHLRHDPCVPAMTDEELKAALIHGAAQMDDLRERATRARHHRTAAPEV